MTELPAWTAEQVTNAPLNGVCRWHGLPNETRDTGCRLCTPKPAQRVEETK